jgi:hypothetical protein
MDQPNLLLVGWLVFAVAMGFKVWRLSRLINRQLRASAWGMERFRAALEQNWQRSESLR